MTDDPHNSAPGDRNPPPAQGDGDSDSSGDSAPDTPPGPAPGTENPAAAATGEAAAAGEGADPAPEATSAAASEATDPEVTGPEVTGKTAGDPAVPAPDSAVPGDGAPDGADADGADPVGARLAELESEAAGLRDRLLRALAEADNARKRAAREVADSRKYGATGLARDMLGVADNLGRALAALPDVARERDEMLFNLRAGVAMTLEQMQQALERHGVKKVTPGPGERFDPNRHQAMFEVPTADHAPGTVAQAVQDGYLLHDRLLRPAMVGVARQPPAAKEAPADEAPAGDTQRETPEDTQAAAGAAAPAGPAAAARTGAA